MRFLERLCRMEMEQQQGDGSGGFVLPRDLGEVLGDGDEEMNVTAWGCLDGKRENRGLGT